MAHQEEGPEVGRSSCCHPEHLEEVAGKIFLKKINKAVKIEKITKQNIYTQVAFHINLISIIVFLKTSERP